MSNPEPIKSGWGAIFGILQSATNEKQLAEEAKDRASKAKKTSEKVNYDPDYKKAETDAIRRYPDRRPENHA